MTKRNPYEQRTDIERIESQWRKMTGLHTREEWSAAVIRAATAAEIAANLAIRREFSKRSQFDEKLMNHFLVWANGLDGKINKLLLPMLEGEAYFAAVKNLCKGIKRVNDTRNRIAHRGEFCNEKEANEIIVASKEFVLGLVQVYEPHFSLNEKADL